MFFSDFANNPAFTLTSCTTLSILIFLSMLKESCFALSIITSGLLLGWVFFRSFLDQPLTSVNEPLTYMDKLSGEMLGGLYCWARIVLLDWSGDRSLLRVVAFVSLSGILFCLSCSIFERRVRSIMTLSNFLYCSVIFLSFFPSFYCARFVDTIFRVLCWLLRMFLIITS